jgi:aquaporin Z
MFKKYLTEFLGTFWLVLGGCGSALLSAAFPKLGIGFLGVALAFGFTLMTMGLSLAPLSNCHFNPAVTIGLYAAGRFELRKIPGFILAQVIGACLAAFVLYLIVMGKPEFNLIEHGLAANGYALHSPGGYAWSACFLSECLLTGMFVLIVLLAGKNLPDNLRPIVIGLG